MLILQISGLISGLLLTVSTYVSELVRNLNTLYLLVPPYECGFEPYNTAYKFAIAKFYVVAVLFLLFDLEVSYLLPAAVIFPLIPALEYIAGIFILLQLLLIGFGFERKHNLVTLSHTF